MDKSKASDEQTTSRPSGRLAALSSGQRALVGAASVGAILIVGWLGSGLLLSPSVEVGEAEGNMHSVSVQNCDASWLNRKIDGLRKHCHLGNIDQLRRAESALYERYEALQLEYRAVVQQQNAEDPEVRKGNHDLLWPEEAAVRQQAAALSGADGLQPLAFAETLYLGRMQQLSTFIADIRKRVDFAKAKAQAQAAASSEPSPYSIPPVADTAAIKVPIVGQSGPFNVYAIEPKDDLDAQHYFIGSDRVEPDMLVGMLPVIENVTAQQQGLKCEFLCADAQGNIVGRKRVYVDDHPAK